MPTLGEVAQASKIWQVFSLAERDEKFGTISVIAWVSSVLGELSSWHDKRKWLSSPTPSLHSWQVLSIRGVLGDLYRPVSTSRGRHPHLSCATILLLFSEADLIIYCSLEGVTLISR